VNRTIRSNTTTGTMRAAQAGLFVLCLGACIAWTTSIQAQQPGDGSGDCDPGGGPLNPPGLRSGGS
jgi:hypothetical protein